jgi:prephenate dehydrogenase
LCGVLPDMSMRRLVLIGVGLIGGSLALDLKRAGLVDKVAGIDIDADNLTRALERRVIDCAYTRIDAESVADADMVLIATPVNTLPLVCRELAPYLPAQCIVTDVGSTKQLALQAFASELPHHYPRCVAAHPIAGSDRHGALAAQFGLFAQKKCIVCAHEHQDETALQAVVAMWQAVQAQIYHLDVARHDAIFAAVSHLPHMLAYAYVHQLAEAANADELLQFAGSGFRDFTRIAASHPQIWTDICLANREVLAGLLQQQQQELVYLQQCLQQGDAQKLTAFFAKAQKIREDWQN